MLKLKSNPHGSLVVVVSLDQPWLDLGAGHCSRQHDVRCSCGWEVLGRESCGRNIWYIYLYIYIYDISMWEQRGVRGQGKHSWPGAVSRLWHLVTVVLCLVVNLSIHYDQFDNQTSSSGNVRNYHSDRHDLIIISFNSLHMICMIIINNISIIPPHNPGQLPTCVESQWMLLTHPAPPHPLQTNRAVTVYTSETMSQS